MSKLICGIYLITRISTGQMYVGQSIDIHKRFLKHCNGDNSSRVDRAIKKYGKDDFELKILKICKPKYLDRFEMLYIRILNTFKDDFHYNLTVGGCGPGFGKDNHSFKDYPTIQKAGFKGEKQQYFLVYYGKRMLGSYDKNKLQKYIDDGTWIKFYEGKDIEYIKKERNSNVRRGENHSNYISEVTVTEILELLDNGFSMVDVASKLNVSMSVLRERLKNNLSSEEYESIKERNIKRLAKFKDNNNAWCNLDDELIYVEYMENNKSLNYLSKEHNVSRGTIKNHIIYYAENNNLPFKKQSSQNRKDESLKIIKTGFDKYKNQKYTLIYKSTSLKTTIFYEDLDEYIKNPNLAEELYDKIMYKRYLKNADLDRITRLNYYIESNNIEFYRVIKRKNTNNFTACNWIYTNYSSKSRKSVSSTDICKLKEKVLANGWVWKRRKPKKPKPSKKYKSKEEVSFAISKRVNKSGIYCVGLHRSRSKSSTLWVYKHCYGGKTEFISSVDLNKLKDKIIHKGYSWIILDEEKAKKSFELNKELGNEDRITKNIYSLWDTSKTQYKSSLMFKNNNSNLNPRRCFLLKFNNKKISCGTFNEFISPIIIHDLIKEAIE